LVGAGTALAATLKSLHSFAPKVKLLQLTLAWHCFLQSALDLMFAGWLRGAVFLLLPVGVAAQVSRLAGLLACWPCVFVLPVFVLPVFVFPVVPCGVPVLVLVLEFEVFAPLGLAVVGFTAGTLVHALSKATKFELPWLGTCEAATEKSIHLMVLSTMPKTKDWHCVFAVQDDWQACAV
jgi:hypothetical protein